MWKRLVLAALATLFVASGCGGDSEESTASPTKTDGSQTPAQSPEPSASKTPGTTQPASTATPNDSGAAWNTYSDESGVSFPTPPGLTTSESTSPLELRSGQSVVVRTVTLRNSSADVVLSLSVTPNPEARSVPEWVETYPGWPGESIDVAFAGVTGILFEEDQAGDANATVYFASSDTVFGLRGKTGTTSSSDGVSPPTISRADFDRVWQGIEFN